MSKRTLQRRLAEQGTCYSEALDQVRFDVAKRLLLDGHKSITEISKLLGYSHVTHFSRAFRRIAGITPHLYAHRASD